MSSRKRDHEFKLIFRGGYEDPTITITSTPSHLLCIKGSRTGGKVHYDVTNIDGAAAYISGVFQFGTDSFVELVNETTNIVIASWDYMALRRTDPGQMSINNVKSILKSLQIREE